MQYIAIDFETYYDKEYSLRKMTPAQYILDERYETITCGVSVNGASALTIDGPNVGRWLDRLDPANTCLISHNALFDMCICAWRYGFTPHLMVDTMSMARALVSHAQYRGSVSLEKVGEQLGIGSKGSAVHTVIGLNRHEIINRGMMHAYAEYCRNDTDMCWAIFKKLRALFPVEQFATNDMIIRMTTYPQFVLDREMLAHHAHQIKIDKQVLLDNLGETYEGGRSSLMSNAKFAELLLAEGVTPPIKISKTTGELTYAFAKTDAEFTDLEEHDSPVVQALVAARLGFKSTIEETRTDRLIAMGGLLWPAQATRLTPESNLPVPLRFSGAHTHRASGDWKINMQNLPNRGKLPSALRAPDGYKVVSIDSSQIEARINAWLGGETELLQAFENGDDPYALFASDIYGFTVNKRDFHAERFVGKTCILGLGYGLGPTRFCPQIISDSRKQGVTLPLMNPEEAARIVKLYRNKFKGITGLWRTAGQSISGMAQGLTSRVIGPCVLGHNNVLLPSGMRLYYDNLRQRRDDDGRMQWVYTRGGATHVLHGPKLVENLCQALNWCIVMGAALRLKNKLQPYGVQLAHQLHDALVYIVPDDLVDNITPMLMYEMRARPSWAQDLPLDAEIKVGQTYGSMK